MPTALLSFRLRYLAVLFGLLFVLGACSSGETEAAAEVDPGLIPQTPEELQSEAARVMGETQSVRFTIERSEAAVYIDQIESISLDSIEGRFSVPSSADAIIGVTVNDSLRTELGAIAIGEEVWLTNPAPGTFETLPPGFDIDPSSFFDPVGGWQPLIEGLTDLELLGQVERDGETRFQLRGTAAEEEMRAITAGLVRDQEVEIDLWINPTTREVTSVEFSTEFDGAVSGWQLELTEYGETFDISPPEE